MANQPIRYELAGDNIVVTYFTTSLTGLPTFDYHDAVEARSFTGDQIKSVVQTDIGTLITVVMRQTPDVGSTTFSVLLPDVNLPPSGLVQVVAEGITTQHRSALVPFEGQTQFYTVREMEGSAQHVFF